MTFKELFEMAEEEVRKKGLYEAVSTRVDAINDAVGSGNAVSKIQTLTAEILNLVAANERVNPSKLMDERDVKDEQYSRWFDVGLKHKGTRA